MTFVLLLSACATPVPEGPLPSGAEITADGDVATWGRYGQA
jgi:hypothetical protein